MALRLLSVLLFALLSATAVAQSGGLMLMVPLIDANVNGTVSGNRFVYCSKQLITRSVSAVSIWQYPGVSAIQFRAGDINSARTLYVQGSVPAFELAGIANQTGSISIIVTSPSGVPMPTPDTWTIFNAVLTLSIISAEGTSLPDFDLAEFTFTFFVTTAAG